MHLVFTLEFLLLVNSELLLKFVPEWQLAQFLLNNISPLCSDEFKAF